MKTSSFLFPPGLAFPAIRSESANLLSNALSANARTSHEPMFSAKPTTVKPDNSCNLLQKLSPSGLRLRRHSAPDLRHCSFLTTLARDWFARGDRFCDMLQDIAVSWILTGQERCSGLSK
jgi:hypothetical protein